MGEEGEGDDAAGVEIEVELGKNIEERLHLEGSEDLKSGVGCEISSQVAISECPEEVKSSARNSDLKPETRIRASDISNSEDHKPVSKISKNKEQKKKVPRHRRFWESSDCSCSKEVA